MHRPALRAVAVAAAAVLLDSCASVAPFAPDMAAKAPKLEGYGRSQVAITTSSAEAHALFNAAVLQAYAFNENEAVRMFKAALAKDPGCAMCAWGVAWQLGPNINNTDRDNAGEALKYVDYALKRLDRATPRERALVQSLAVRYAHETTARETAPLVAGWCGKADKEPGAVHPLDEAYAAQLRKLVAAYPDDADVTTLYAEAEMIATEGDTPWDDKGKPAGRLGEVADRLEKLMATQPEHTGLNHYTVHVLDAASVAKRAVPAADRLGRLAPASPHLVHMPAHTYVNVGRFEDAARVNELAVAADVEFAAQSKAQGFESSKDWRLHNSHFLWYAAIVSGQEQRAMTAAATAAAVSTDTNFGDYLRSLRYFTLMRFERWQQLLAESQPTGQRGIAKAHWTFARGVAQARLGQADAAAATLEELKPLAASVKEKNAKRKLTVAMMDHALARLEAELALARGDLGAAITAQAKAAEAGAVLDKPEPPFMAELAPAMLAELQMKARRWDDAEATWKRMLASRPGHPVAEKGLREVQAARRS